MCSVNDVQVISAFSLALHQSDSDPPDEASVATNSVFILHHRGHVPPSCRFWDGEQDLPSFLCRFHSTDSRLYQTP
ncbi:unnamed protein product [Ranitomeya imitator]|uniref:Uncharacterized protein n=1 Tax=Ranitomeya imitator TaxID=111125 RepID=A0ABN9M2Q7_9NEOB|nr:unnamed protein product [Ranitomeya imitator]